MLRVEDDNDTCAIRMYYIPRTERAAMKTTIQKKNGKSIIKNTRRSLQRGVKVGKYYLFYFPVVFYFSLLFIIIIIRP